MFLAVEGRRLTTARVEPKPMRNPDPFPLEQNKGDWTPPSQFGDYCLESILDGGGMGVIYKAHHQKTGRLLAIKFMLDPSQYKRFQRETRTAQQLQHRNFVRFHDAGELEGYLYIVMDYVEGQPLKRFLEINHCSVAERLRLFNKITYAIDYAHQSGIIHRDIKPANILIDLEQEPVILDFGLAKYVTSNSNADDKTLTKLTVEGQILGTPGYMSPEQARGETDEQDHRGDIFTLGIILFEMLCHRNPFEGRNFLEICYKIANQPPTPLRFVAPDLPVSLEQICNKALARAKENRYQTARELAEAVQSVLDILEPPEGSNAALLKKKATTRLALRGIINASPSLLPPFVTKATSPMRSSMVEEKGPDEHSLVNESTGPSPDKTSTNRLQISDISPALPQKKTPCPAISPALPQKKIPCPAIAGEIDVRAAAPPQEAQDSRPDNLWRKLKWKGWASGSLGILMAMVPVSQELAIHPLGFLFDLGIGGLCEWGLRKVRGGGWCGIALFISGGSVSLIVKYTLGLGPWPWQRTYLPATLEGMVLLLLLGYSLGLYVQHRAKNSSAHVASQDL